MLRVPVQKQRRNGKSNGQRAALRSYYQSHDLPKPTYEALQSWWEQKFDTKIAKSSISDILSTKYQHLDSVTINFKDSKRARPAKWVVLEECLFEWEQRFEASGGNITGDILRYKATELWNRLPEYTDQECPQWSDGWLSNFKARYRIKERRFFGETGSAAVGEESENIMENIRAVGRSYEAGDIYNFDETGYFWKTLPDRSLGTSRHPGVKKEEARITAALCSNATGTDRLPIWYIGKAARPICFRTAQIRNLSAIGAFWRHNPAAWMDHRIMIEWLQWFDNKMHGRRVLLLMDNFPAHELAVKLLQEEGESYRSLQNTTIMWLPPNTTSVNQPLDQGIIQNWKAKVRSQYTRFIVTMFDNGENPMAKMNVLRALRWGIQAWEEGVTPATIQNCWARSQAIDFGSRPSIPSIWAESAIEVQSIQSDIQRLQASGYIQQAIDIRQFINPVEERITEDPELIIDQIVAQHSTERVAESDEEEEEEVPIIRHSEAISAIKVLLKYQEQQADEGSYDFIRILRIQNREIERKRVQGLNQGNLSSWIM